MSQAKVAVLLSSSLICLTLLHHVSGEGSASGSAENQVDPNSSFTTSVDVNSLATVSSALTNNDGQCTTGGCSDFSTATVYMMSTSSSISYTPTSATPVTTTTSTDVMATPLQTSPPPPADESSSPLEWIEENWTALLIGLGIGLVPGCCGCCLLLGCLYHRKKREVYILECQCQ